MGHSSRSSRHSGIRFLSGRKVRYCSALAPSGNAPERSADVAQLVERNLAKVEVAGSNPVVRSERVRQATVLTREKASVVEWPRGEATACKAVYTGSNPVSTSRTSSGSRWTIGAAVARFPDTEEVTGSIPVSSTKSIGDSCPRRARTGSPSSCCAAALRLPPAGAPPPAPPAPSLRSAAVVWVGRSAHPRALGTAAVAGLGGRLTRGGSVRRQWPGSAVNSPARVRYGGSGHVGRSAHPRGLGSPARTDGACQVGQLTHP